MPFAGKPCYSLISMPCKAEVSNEDSGSEYDSCDDVFVEHAMAEVDKWIHGALSGMNASL